MRQLLLPNDYDGGSTVILRGESCHYIAKVLRFRVGDRIPALDRHGNRFSFHIMRIDGKTCTLTNPIAGPESEHSTQNPELPDITLFQCLPKGQKMDLIVRQAGETGISLIVPTLSERVIGHRDEKRLATRVERWNRIAGEAIQQSGANRAPRVASPLPLDRVPMLWDSSGIGLFLHQEPKGGYTLGEVLDPPESIALCVGPEGGFTPNEVRLLIESGFQPIYLGPTVMRSETAALYGTAAIRTVVLEMKGWKRKE